MKPGKDAPCDCGSGHPYRHCHLPIDVAGPQKRLQAARRVYGERWAVNARHYDAQGCYEWMASRLAPYSPRRAFDIGCGEGSGIVALTRLFSGRDFTLISVEENPGCINTARKKVSSAGFGTNVIRRYNVQILGPKAHALECFPGRLKTITGINLIEGDIIIDQELESLLRSEAKFDAVTVWLIGTHLIRKECHNLHQLEFGSPAEYRLCVHRKAYPVAEAILKPGGVLNIVDRGIVPASDQLRSDILKSHQEIASGMRTSLEVQSLDWREYVEPTSPNRVVMSRTIPASGEAPDISRLAMHSIIAVKR